MNEEKYEDKDTSAKLNEASDITSDKKENEGKKSSLKATIKDIVFFALLFVFCLYVIPTFVIQKTIVDGPSMEDTLHNRDQLMVEKISYHFNSLKRFDIVVFYPYGRADKEYYIKRIIGLPGEIVQIKGKDIYINGEILEEDYGKDPISKAGIAAYPITLEDDEYFVMGDNREVSFDSRYEEVGPVHKKDIGGKAILRVWPLNKFGLLE